MKKNVPLKTKRLFNKMLKLTTTRACLKHIICQCSAKKIRQNVRLLSCYFHTGFISVKEVFKLENAKPMDRLLFLYKALSL